MQSGRVRPPCWRKDLSAITRDVCREEWHAAQRGSLRPWETLSRIGVERRRQHARCKPTQPGIDPHTPAATAVAPLFRGPLAGPLHAEPPKAAPQIRGSKEGMGAVDRSHLPEPQAQLTRAPQQPAPYLRAPVKGCKGHERPSATPTSVKRVKRVLWLASPPPSQSLPPPPPPKPLFPCAWYSSPMDTPPTPIPAEWVVAAAGGGGGEGLADLLTAAAAEVPPASPNVAASVSSSWGSSPLMGFGSPPPPRSQPADFPPGIPGGVGVAACANKARGAPLSPPSLPPSVAKASSFLSPERVAAAVRLVAAAEWRRHHLTGGCGDMDDGGSDDDADGKGVRGGGGDGCGAGDDLGLVNPLDCMAAAAEVMSHAAAAPTGWEGAGGEPPGGGRTDVDCTGSEVSESTCHRGRSIGVGGRAPRRGRHDLHATSSS